MGNSERSAMRRRVANSRWAIRIIVAEIVRAAKG